MSYADLAATKAVSQKIVSDGFIRDNSEMKQEILLCKNLTLLREKNKEKAIEKWYNSFDDIGHFDNMYEMFCKTNCANIDFKKFIRVLYDSSIVEPEKKIWEKLFEISDSFS